MELLLIICFMIEVHLFTKLIYRRLIAKYSTRINLIDYLSIFHDVVYKKSILFFPEAQMIILILLSITILILINLLLIFSLMRLNNGSKNESNEVNISIVIAAKNEEKNINGLLALCTLCIKLFGVPGNEVALRPGGLEVGK